MALTLRDLVAEFMRDLRTLDGDAGPPVPVGIILDEAQAMTRARLQSLRSLGVQCLRDGKEEEAWRILDQCQKAVASFGLLCDVLEAQKSGHNQGMAS